MVFLLKELNKVNINKPVLIVGLPGIGNVGKIAVDFIIDNLKAQKIFDIESYNFPHAVFVNEKNMVELPTIEIYYKRANNKDLLFLAGDIQPIDESSCYEFCNKILDFFEKYNGTEIITIGGIGLSEMPSDPRVYCTANDKKIIEKYKFKNLSNNIYGIVGPIIGVTGVLVGLAGKRNIPSIAFLAETYGHPNYLGIKSAREILKILDSKFNLNLNFTELNKEVTDIEKNLRKKIKQIDQFRITKADERPTSKINYIG